MAYFSGQGVVKVAPRTSTTPFYSGTLRDLGNTPEFKVSLATTVKEHKESRTGQRVTDGRLTTEKKVTVSVTLEDFTKENLAMALYGTTTVVDTDDVVHLFAQAPQEMWLVFEGVNTLDANRQVKVELFRVVFDPFKELGLIQDDYAKFQLDGAALYDDALNTAAGETIGGFGRVTLVNPAA